MSRYDYECQECECVYELEQRITDDKFKEHECPNCEKVTSCVRLISDNISVVWADGLAPTVDDNRGYKGKFRNKIRKKGTPVDAPANKREADQQFQRFIDSGGLQGIKPSMDLKSPGLSQTAEQMVDPKYKPGNKSISVTKK